MASSGKGFPKKAVILVLVLLIGGYFGFKKIYFSLTHETTDNAQIETSIVPVLPRIAGYVKTVFVKDYDSVKQGLASFTVSEQTGYNVFLSKCNSCHTEPLFTNNSYRNNGLPVTALNDFGRMRVTNNKSDSLKFRVPSLRNLFKSYPFMHDGRFVAFSQVFDHYQTGVQQSATLDPLLSNGILLSTNERTALIDFLRTLTDNNFINNSSFTAPQ